MICERCSYYINGECILDLEGAFDADGNPVTDVEDVCMCEHQMEFEE